jgi:hypothetical protein
MGFGKPCFLVIDKRHRQWKLGVDLHEDDNLLDGFTFTTIIDAVRCNEPIINEATVRKTINEVLEQQLEDLRDLTNSNINEIIKRALQGRNK